jgi:predicted DCC family thiol-disulfide oxidoreductase YuxK/uncharacterized membrane protein YphA (DoxX/SURF4 family)
MRERAANPLLAFVQLLGRSVVDFWAKPIRAEPLALMRILTALCVMASALTTIAPNLSTFWSDAGIIPTSVADQYLDYTHRWSLLRGVTSQGAILAWFAVWMLALLLLCMGVFTRFAAVAAFILSLSFNLRALWTLNGGDDVAVQLLFYLMIAPSGAAWSVDALRRRMKQYRDPETGFESPAMRPPPQPAMIPPWSVRLIQVQLVAIYLLNGVNKLNLESSNDYLTGEAVYWALNDATLTRLAFDDIHFPLWLCRLLSWCTLLFEFGFGLFILIPRLRPVVLIGGVLFHAGIFATMEIGWFSQMALCFYPAMLSGAAVAGFVAWLADIGGHGNYLVCYDTFCPVCRRSRRVLELFDVGRRLVWLDIHDRDSMQRHLPDKTYAQALKEILVVAPGGKITGGFDGLRSLARALPALWPLLPLLQFPGVAFLGRRVYKAVAKNRYRLVKCDAGVCNLHLMALSRENLDESEIAKVVQAARLAAK